MNTFKLISLFLFSSIFSFGQEVLYLENSSFEDTPRHSRQPNGWYDCGFPNESPPDTQPGHFEVNKTPYDGQSYVAMVVRENETWEMIGQKLESDLLANQAYSFSIFLCRSQLYMSPSRLDYNPNNPSAPVPMKNHTTPCKLRIWGGNGYCVKTELLAETKLIIHTEWSESQLELMPSENYKYIMLEVFYKTPTQFPYNGNLLMDYASPIIPIDSLTKQRIVQPDPNYVRESTQSKRNKSNTKVDKSISPKRTQYQGNSTQREMTSLRTLIAKRGDDVEFTFDEEDIVSDGKRFLNKLIEKMDSFDEPTTLVIAVYNEIKDADIKVEIIQEFMDTTNLNADEYEVRKVKRSDKLKSWQSDNGIVKIRLKQSK